MSIDQFIELMKALSSIIWPILVIIAFVKLLPSIRSFLSREKVSVKFAGMEITAEQVAESLARQVKDLQDKMVELEERIVVKAVHGERQFSDEHIKTRIEGFRILWVDDFPSNNAIQIEKLAKDGFLVDIASTTIQAVAMFDDRHYNLIISDMGRIEDGKSRRDAGVDLARAIRKRDDRVPIIIFSTSASIERFKAEATAAGVNLLTTSTVELYRAILTRVAKSPNAD